MTNIIYHEDARNAHEYFEDNTIDCIITDPPYGVNFVSRRAETAEGQKLAQKKVNNDEDLEQALALFNRVLGPLTASKMKPDSDLYVFTRWDIVDVWMDAVKKLPMIEYKMLLIWDKGGPGMGDIDANWGCGHELILYAKKGRRDVHHRRSGILAYPRVQPSEAIHQTEKPTGLLEELIRMSTNVGDLVVDTFSGSGSTSVAAERAKRRSVAFENDAEHYRNSTRRMSQGSLF